MNTTVIAAKDVIRVATRGYTNGTVKGVRTYLHINCGCRIASSLVGTYSTMDEARRAASAELEGTGDYLRQCSKSGLVKARALARPVRRFDDTMRAAGAPWNGAGAHDGDVIVIASEGVVGIVVRTAVIAITAERGNLMGLDTSARELHDGLYAEIVDRAEVEARKLGAAVNALHAAPAATALLPTDVAREDDVKVKRDGANQWTVIRGRDCLGVIFDDGREMTRGRYSAWAPYAGTPGNFGGFSDDPAVTVEWIVQAWPTTAGEIAAETGAPLETVLTAAEAVAEEWGTARRAVLRIAAAKGAATKITRPAAEAVRERLAAAEEPAPAVEEEDPAHCVSILGGKVHEVMPGFDGSDGRPVHYFPLCRTGASTNRGTRYQKTKQELTCTTCLTYQERRRAARERKAAAAV
ncbi:hypothetical protein [Streptomyces collinus]